MRLIPIVNHVQGYIEDVHALFLARNRQGARDVFREALTVVQEPLRNRLNEAVYDRLTGYLEANGSGGFGLERIPIYYINRWIFMPRYHDEPALQERLEAVASEHRVPSGSLVPFWDRFELVDIVEGFNADNIISFSLDTVEQHLAREEERLNSYIAADVGALVENPWLGCEDPTAAEWCETVDAYLRAMELEFHQRNFTIAFRIDEAMWGNTIFAAVDAGHLPGEGGVLSLLADRVSSSSLCRSCRCATMACGSSFSLPPSA
ncbi:MAG: TraB/GumN family protein [Pseudomonadota bacterium]